MGAHQQGGGALSLAIPCHNFQAGGSSAPQSAPEPSGDSPKAMGMRLRASESSERPTPCREPSADIVTTFVSPQETRTNGRCSMAGARPQRADPRRRAAAPLMNVLALSRLVLHSGRGAGSGASPTNPPPGFHCLSGIFLAPALSRGLNSRLDPHFNPENCS